MAEISLAQFRNNVADVARPNRFWVTIGDVGGASIAESIGTNNAVTPKSWDGKYEFMAKTTSLPGRTMGNIDLNWQGMKYNIAGDPSFDDITMTFLNHYAWDLRLFFETWIEKIAQMHTNERSAPKLYKSDKITMNQLGRTAKDLLATYTLVGAYPTVITPLDLTMETPDSTEEISVTFKYDYFAVGGAAPNAGAATVI